VEESGRTREAECATTHPKTARPLRSTSRTPESAPRRCSCHFRSARTDGAAARTDQYDRLASIEVGGGEGELTVHLTPRPGEHLDPDALGVPAWTTPWNLPPTLRRRRARIVCRTGAVDALRPKPTVMRRWLRAARQAKALAWSPLAWMTGEVSLA